MINICVHPRSCISVLLCNTKPASLSELFLSLCLPSSVQDKPEVAAVPLALENRNCVLIRRDLVALPASLISQIGYRCHPKLYTEGDPGEKLELVAGRHAHIQTHASSNTFICLRFAEKNLHAVSLEMNHTSTCMHIWIIQNSSNNKGKN